MEITIRKAKSSDLPALLRITNYAIEHTDSLWMNTPFTLDQRQHWMAERRAHGFPIYAAVNKNDDLMGYASYGPFRSFEGFAKTVEHSIYVTQELQGRGIGHLLLSHLINHAKESGFHVMVAGITVGNNASIHLHEKFDFQKSGILPQVGFKNDRWLDLLFMTLRL